MELEIFENMDAPDLRKYIQFLLWHYRVVDALMSLMRRCGVGWRLWQPKIL